MPKNSFMKNYGLLIFMVGGIVIGCIVGALFPNTYDADGKIIEQGASVLKPLGQIFINFMFCIVVPLVFASISSAIANMKSRKRAGKIMGTTLISFLVTGLIASAIMLIMVNVFPPVEEAWQGLKGAAIDEQLSTGDLIVNFLTAEDFVGLLSRKAMLPLIIFSIIFGFAVQLNGGPKTKTAQLIEDLSNCLMKLVKIITYYAPIAFFGFFADLVATYGAQIAGNYGKALAMYYPLVVLYLFIFFPIYAKFGGGKYGIKEMFKRIARPAFTALGTCSSAATIPTNLQVCKETGVPKDVSEIVVPLGATMHMDGSCLACVLKIAFLFGVFGMPYDTPGTMIAILVVSVLSSVAMSSIPGGGYIGEFIVCSLFFPNQLELAYPIAITIGNLVDPPATMLNSAGDYVMTFVVSRFTDGKDWLDKAIARRKAHGWEDNSQDEELYREEAEAEAEAVEQKTEVK